MIDYNEETKQIEMVFPDYQTEINFPPYKKNEDNIKDSNIKYKNPSQLKLKFK